MHGGAGRGGNRGGDGEGGPFPRPSSPFPLPPSPVGTQFANPSAIRASLAWISASGSQRPFIITPARRATLPRSSGLSGWLCLLFFVPFLNYLLMS